MAPSVLELLQAVTPRRGFTGKQKRRLSPTPSSSAPRSPVITRRSTDKAVGEVEWTPSPQKTSRKLARAASPDAAVEKPEKDEEFADALALAAVMSLAEAAPKVPEASAAPATPQLHEDDEDGGEAAAEPEVCAAVQLAPKSPETSSTKAAESTEASQSPVPSSPGSCSGEAASQSPLTDEDEAEQPVTSSQVEAVAEAASSLSAKESFDLSRRLAAAVCEGSLEEVQAAFREATFASVRSEDSKVNEKGGRSLALLAATQRKELEVDETQAICRYLANVVGVEVNRQEGPQRGPPLHYAAKAGSAAGIRLLLDMRADPEFADVNGQTPLFHAAAASCVEGVWALVAAGADVQRRDAGEQTPLFYAASKEAGAECVEILLESLAAQAQAQEPVTRESTASPQLAPTAEPVEQSEDAHAEVSQEVAGATEAAVGDAKEAPADEPEASADAMEEALAQVMEVAEAEVSGVAETAAASDEADGPEEAALFAEPAEAGNLKLDAPRDASGRTPLFVAAQLGHSAVCRMLLNSCPGVDDVDQFGQSAIFFAAAKGKDGCIEALLDASASVDLRDKVGQTALFHATSRRHLAACQLLVKRGADPWVTDDKGMTPLDVVTERRSRSSKFDIGAEKTRMSEIVSFLTAQPGRPEVTKDVQSVRRGFGGAKHLPGAKRRQVEEHVSVEVQVPKSADDKDLAAAVEVPSTRRSGRGGAKVATVAASSRGRPQTRASSTRASSKPVEKRRRKAQTCAEESMGDEPADAPEQTVLEWLASFGLGAFADAIAKEGYEDLQLLRMLEKDELEEMFDTVGVRALGHRVKFRRAFQALCRR